ncbi:MAG: hypothetical protein E6J34_24345, partial [Chloroflexi bacterium]
IDTITNWPEITSLKQLRAFLGLTGYYRRFIQNYAQIAIPLTNLLKEESLNEWNDSCQEAKETLIKTIMTAPLLQTPDYSAPFTVTTDASDVALGGVLSQSDKPITFTSKTFSGAETNWIIYEKELFAIVYAAVTYIQNQEKITAKQARWLTYMAQFNYIIIHRPGSQNQVADAISRRDIFGITTIDNQHWIERLRQLSTKVELKPWMNVRNGLIYKDNRLYVPGYPDIRKTIIQEIHQGFGGGHFGLKKTLEKVARNYYWEKMAATIDKFIKTCDTCQRTKSSTQKPFGLLQPIPPPTDKFQTKTIDFIGPLRTTIH